VISILAYVSFLLFSIIIILSYFPGFEKNDLARRFPKLSPTIRVWAVLVMILAVDFAVISLIRCPSIVALRLVVSDAILVLASVLHMMLFKTSLRGLWALAFSVGLACLATMPRIG
jgi:hypothetical protein